MKINKFYVHVLYWILVVILLTILFGRSWVDSVNAFYFISLLLPVIIATSYFFNYYLVPKFLLQKRYLRFFLYMAYTFILSLFLEMGVLIFTFTCLLKYNFSDMSSNASDTLLLAVVMYLIVFVTSAILITIQLVNNQSEVLHLRENMSKLKQPFLQITSKRKPVRIAYEDLCYIESLTDFIKIRTISKDEIISTEKISVIEKKLPDTFLRIHRSFVVNLEKVTGFDYYKVRIQDTALPIGRTYKKKVQQRLHGNV